MTAPSIARAVLFTLVLAFAGCGRQPNSKPRTAHALLPTPLVSKAEPGQFGGRLVIATAASPKTFNPVLALDAGSENINRLLYASLLNLNWTTQEPSPGLAESWSVEPDQKTWRFRLRQGVRWSDGVPLTTDDVVFTWNEIMNNPEVNRSTYELFRIGGTNITVSKVDDFTVRVATPEVFPPLLEVFGPVAILPRHILGDSVKEGRFPLAYGLRTSPQRLVGSGPYCLEEFQPGKFTLLERNPEYWVTDTQGRRLPYLDEVMFTVSGGPGTETLPFLSGKSDVYETMRPENYESFKQASSGGRFQLAELGVGTELSFFWFNQNTGTNPAGKPLVNPVKLRWFRNRKFRQAVSCAIDRERMVREIYQGRAQPTYGFISAENRKWNNPNTPRFGYDPARARALLGEIGIQDRNGDGVLEDAEGNPVEIVFNAPIGNPGREKAAVTIQEDLKKLGIKVDLQPLDFKTLVDKINSTFDYECALLGLGGGGLDPASQMRVLKSNEELHQWFPYQKTPSTDWEAEIDKLMDAQMRTLDFAERKKDFDQVQVILAEETPMIYTVSPFLYSAIRADIGNVRPSALAPYHVTWNLEELYFKKK
jgi:peptide/nickel transport system substrate-binding protein